MDMAGSWASRGGQILHIWAWAMIRSVQPRPPINYLRPIVQKNSINAALIHYMIRHIFTWRKARKDVIQIVCGVRNHSDARNTMSDVRVSSAPVRPLRVAMRGSRDRFWSPRVIPAYYTPSSNLVDFLPLPMTFCAFGAKSHGTGKNMNYSTYLYDHQ